MYHFPEGDLWWTWEGQYSVWDQETEITYKVAGVEVTNIWGIQHWVVTLCGAPEKAN